MLLLSWHGYWATKTLILNSLQQVTAGDVFAMLDADGTGMLSIEEFRRGLGFLKP